MGKPSPLAIGSHVASRECRQKYKKQRINKGYSFWDLADMDTFLLELIPSMLEEMATRDSPIPSDMTEDKWNAWLLDTAKKFRRVSAISEDWDEWLKDADAQKALHEQSLKDAFDALREHFFSLWI